MRAIPLERIGEYLATAIVILHEKKNSCSSRDLITELEKRFAFSDYERSLSDTGGVRWITKFRFWTIGLVKAGIIKKQKKVWYLTDTGQKIIGLPPKEYVQLSSQGYEEWEKTRIQNSLDEQKPFVPVQPPPIVKLGIKPDIIKFDELLKGVDKGLIQIPPFQRNFVWSPREIVDLLDSIYRGYPIGSFIFWKTTTKLPKHRFIAGLSLQEPPDRSELDYVLDGQQRITSLYAAVKGAGIEDEPIHFYFDVSRQGFDYERGNPEETPHASDINVTRIPLDKIFVSAPEYFEYVNSFPKEYKLVLHDLYNRISTYTFSVIYVLEDDDKTTDDLKQIVHIFTKINDTGKKLTVVALMIARCWGENFDLRSKLNELLDSSTEFVDIKEETILQIASVILNDMRCRNSVILKETNIDQLRDNWDDIVSAFKLALDFVRNKLRIKNIRYIPFDSMLVPLAYFHHLDHNPSAQQADKLCQWFWKAGLSNRYGSTVSGKIEEDCESLKRLVDGETVEFDYTIGWDTMRDRLIHQDYYFRNAFCKTVLTLYSYIQPKHFKDNRDIDLSGNFSDYSKHNLHHLFPRNYLDRTKNPLADLKDSIVNIAFAPMLLNLEISARIPSEYMAEFQSENPEFSQTLSSHLIDDMAVFGITNNDFDTFLSKRAEKIENKFRLLLSLKSKTEQQFDEKPVEPIDIFEIRMRELICNILEKTYGENCWEQTVPSDIRMAVAKKIDDDKKLHPYDQEKYSFDRSKFELLDVMDYFKIIMANWNLFEEIFVSPQELQKHFLAVKNFRNPLKHVRELDDVDRKNAEAAILWFERIIQNFQTPS